jgi:hypothetical protein
VCSQKLTKELVGKSGVVAFRAAVAHPFRSCQMKRQTLITVFALFTTGWIALAQPAVEGNLTASARRALPHISTNEIVRAIALGCGIQTGPPSPLLSRSPRRRFSSFFFGRPTAIIWRLTSAVWRAPTSGIWGLPPDQDTTVSRRRHSSGYTAMTGCLRFRCGRVRGGLDRGTQRPGRL